MSGACVNLSLMFFALRVFCAVIYAHCLYCALSHSIEVSYAEGSASILKVLWLISK